VFEVKKSDRWEAEADVCVRQEGLLRHMTPARRLQIAQELLQTAWELKQSGLRAQYPEWTEEQIRAKARRVFITGYAGA
jgi:hypothetical protein